MRVRECKLDRHDYFAGTIRALFSICLCLGRTRDKARRKVHRSTHCHRRRQIGVHKPISSDVAPETIFRNAPTRNDTSADVNSAAPVPLLFEAIKRFFFSLLSTHSKLLSICSAVPGRSNHGSRAARSAWGRAITSARISFPPRRSTV